MHRSRPPGPSIEDPYPSSANPPMPQQPRVTRSGFAAISDCLGGMGLRLEENEGVWILTWTLHITTPPATAGTGASQIAEEEHLFFVSRGAHPAVLHVSWSRNVADAVQLWRAQSSPDSQS